MSRVGILGGGQLALMTAEAARALDVEIVVLEKCAGSPAGRFVGLANEVVGDWRDEATLHRLADCCDVVTIENEFVDAGALEWLVARGCPVYPSPATVRTIQDKVGQKEALARAGLPVARFRAVASLDDVQRAAEELGWPLVLKARRNGYDGYGNATLRRSEDAAVAMARLGAGTSAGAAGGLYVEEWVPFVQELAVMIARRSDEAGGYLAREGVLGGVSPESPVSSQGGPGAVSGVADTAGDARAFPVVETVQRDHICHEVIAPARVPAEVAERARQAAMGAVEAVDGIGVTGVELFLLADGEILVNELAPRPHNSGHYSIEGCRTSQFANHLLGVLGRPLGATDLLKPGVAMVNVLGTKNGLARPRGLDAAAKLAHVHIYGKAEVRVGRKMGHVTALADTPGAALAQARRAAEAIQW